MSRNPKFASIGLVEIGEELARLRQRGESTGRGLVGRFFHSFEDGEIDWQGEVVGDIGDGRYLVALFSWLDGCSYKQQIVALNDMATWSFYDSSNDMNAAYARSRQGRADDRSV